MLAQRISEERPQEVFYLLGLGAAILRRKTVRNWVGQGAPCGLATENKSAFGGVDNYRSKMIKSRKKR
ncbi:MAG: hypothetical protein JXB29_12955 [Sedimentisphaerales bacterium]|nr:hypothetical protein [Sedimentisphaerales bacterium]